MLLVTTLSLLHSHPNSSTGLALSDSLRYILLRLQICPPKRFDSYNKLRLLLLVTQSILKRIVRQYRKESGRHLTHLFEFDPSSSFADLSKRSSIVGIKFGFARARNDYTVHRGPLKRESNNSTTSISCYILSPSITLTCIPGIPPVFSHGVGHPCINIPKRRVAATQEEIQQVVRHCTITFDNLKIHSFVSLKTLPHK